MEEISDLNSFLPPVCIGLCDYLLLDGPREDSAASRIQMVAEELDCELVMVKEVNGNARWHVVTVLLFR